MQKSKKTECLQLRVYNGDKVKRSNDEIEQVRQHTEKMKVGEKVFVVTDTILQNKHALKKWNELVKIYKDFEFVTEIDIGIIEEYCMAHAEYYELLEARQVLQKQIPDKLKLYHAIDELKIDHNTNKKLEILIKLSDRLFLNPAVRLRSVPKKQEEPKQTYLESLGFGNI